MNLENYYNKVRNYYNKPAIKEGLYDFFDKAEFAVGFGKYLTERKWKLPKVVPLAKIDELINDALDLFRPLRDGEDRYLLAVLDYEFFTHDDLYFLYSHQKEVFKRIDKLSKYLEAQLNNYKIKFLIDMTVSGGHVITAIPTNSIPYNILVEFGHIGETLKEKYSLVILNDPTEIKRKRAVDEKLGLAYSGLGKVMEFLAHNVIRELRNTIDYPITICDTVTGNKDYPRKGLSLDISQYCDPFFMRVIRSLFSTHQKHLMWNLIDRPPAVDIIRNGQSIDDIIRLMWNMEEAGEFYKNNYFRLPISEEGWLSLIEDYKKSPLFKAHVEYENQVSKDEDFDLFWKHFPTFPPCIRQIFNSPNPEMLKPTNVQFLTKVFLKLGLSAKNCADVILNFFNNPLMGWHNNNNTIWSKYDAYSRAMTYVRFYYGLIKDNLDTLDDLTCEIHKRKGYCPTNICGITLEDYLEKKNG